MLLKLETMFYQVDTVRQNARGRLILPINSFDVTLVFHRHCLMCKEDYSDNYYFIYCDLKYVLCKIKNSFKLEEVLVIIV